MENRAFTNIWFSIKTNYIKLALHLLNEALYFISISVATENFNSSKTVSFYSGKPLVAAPLAYCKF